MKRVFLIAASIFLVSSVGFGAKLNVDASKKKNTRIIQPELFKTKQNSKFQNKRYTSSKLIDSTVLHRDSEVTYSTKKPGDSKNAANDQMADIGQKNAFAEQDILNKVVTSSEEFERAYRKALTVELSKRAAAQVEIKKTKANLKQSDINRDAKVRRSKEDGFKVQQAGIEGD